MVDSDSRGVQLYPYYSTTDRESILLYLGDVVDVLRLFPSRSVQMVVTSPPYWGLRDYQTSRWEGGEINCDHTNGESSKSTKKGLANHLCIKCGARYINQQIGSEPSPDCNTYGQAQCDQCFVCSLVKVFREVKRVLRLDGIVWLNLGDTYSSGSMSGKQGPNSQFIARSQNANKFQFDRSSCGLPPGDLIGIPWRVAFALQHDGWFLRQDIIWSKNAMPESMTNRCTKSHEYIFLLTQTQDYFYDQFAIREKAISPPHNPGNRKTPSSGMGGANNITDTEREWSKDGTANKRSVWNISTYSYEGAHFAVFPPKLIEPCILAGTSAYGACIKCGAPWKRELTGDRRPTRDPTNGKAYLKMYGGIRGSTKAGVRCSTLDQVVGNRDPLRHCTAYATTGWVPTCYCNLSTSTRHIKPCVVLDPFIGSGTTAVVSIQHGRHCWGIELSEEYLKGCAIPRIEGTLLSIPSLSYLSTQHDTTPTKLDGVEL